MRWFLDHYLRGPDDAADPHAVPLRAASLAGLPPALVQVAQYDLLRDEGQAYAARLRQAGVATVLSCWAGMNHGFMQSAGRIDTATAAMDQATAWLRDVGRGAAP